MKKTLLITFILLSLFSCRKNNDKHYEGSKNFRSDMESFVEFALRKDYLEMQLYYYTSDGFKKDYFAGEVTQDEYLNYFKTISQISEKIEDYQAAIKQLNKAGILFTPTKSIAGSAADFFNWISGTGKRSRERILTVASNLSAGDRTELYSKLRPDWKSKSSSEADFWNKLEKGDYDSQAPQMFSDFQIDNENFAFTSAEKNLTLQKIVVSEGVEGVKAGSGLYVDAIGDITGMGTGMDIANMAVMTGDLIEADNMADKVEIAKNMAKTSFGLGLDFGDYDYSTVYKYCLDAADVSAKSLMHKLTNSKELASNDKAIINLVDTDSQSSGDIAVAVGNSINDLGKWASSIFVSIGKTSDGSVPLKVDAGDYKVTLIDKQGNKETQKVSVKAGNIETITVETISPNDREGEAKEDDKVSEKWNEYLSQYSYLSYFIPFTGKITRESLSDEGVNNLFDGEVWSSNAECKKYMELYEGKSEWTQDSDSSTKYFYKYVTIDGEDCRVAVSWRTKSTSVSFTVHSPNTDFREDW